LKNSTKFKQNSILFIVIDDLVALVFFEAFIHISHKKVLIDRIESLGENAFPLQR